MWVHNAAAPRRARVHILLHVMSLMACCARQRSHLSPAGPARVSFRPVRTAAGPHVALRPVVHATDEHGYAQSGDRVEMAAARARMPRQYQAEGGVA